MSRRSFLSVFSAGVCGASLVNGSLASNVATFADDISNNKLSCVSPRFCLNLGTIRNYNLNLNEELKIAKEAGFSSVELWLDRLGDCTKNGDVPFDSKKLIELKKRLDGEGIQVEGGIGFATWIMNEPERRASGLDELKRQSEALATIGCPCIACPAAGPWNEKIEGIDVIAERYAAALSVCSSFGVRALLELWGPSPTLSKLSDCLAICAETGRDDAALLLDVYHLYRGGNSFSALKLVAGSAMPVFHMNDYPAEPEREKLNDSDRVFTGDGIAPLRDILATLYENGFDGVLSLELFNKEYAKQMSALEQAKTGLAKMRALFE